MCYNTHMSEIKKFPEALPFKQLIGPSFVILALGLGSGEVILWPYLVSNYGLGIAWGALVGITFQYFINMEIERYALVKGESVFVGFHRYWPRSIYWFIVSTFISFGLPGIIAASAKILSSLFGLNNFVWLAVGLLIFIGLILSLGKTVYGLMEKLTKTIILLGVPIIFILALIVSDQTDWATLASGLIGQGDGYMFLPAGIALATFLGAFAYSGAGGNLNLTQSIYVKEKGYGMGKYAHKIAGLFRSSDLPIDIKLTGHDFEPHPNNIKNFKAWWKNISLEHAVVFWLIGSLSMLLLMLLSYATTFGSIGNATGINFIINEGAAIGKIIGPWAGAAFLLVTGIMLFQTQLGVMDSTSRIMAENAALKKMSRAKTTTINLAKYYYSFLWAQIAFGIILFLLGLNEPKTLIVLGAVLNAVAMFVHVGLTTLLNRRALPAVCQPRFWRKIILAVIFIFFGLFSGLVIWTELF